MRPNQKQSNIKTSQLSSVVRIRSESTAIPSEKLYENDKKLIQKTSNSRRYNGLYMNLQVIESASNGFWQ